MRPSARNAETNRPSTRHVELDDAREAPAFVMTTSFRTSPVDVGLARAGAPPRAAAAAPRTGSARRGRLRGSGRARGGAISVRKPRLPKFTPSTGTVRSSEAAGREQGAVAARAPRGRRRVGRDLAARRRRGRPAPTPTPPRRGRVPRRGTRRTPRSSQPRDQVAHGRAGLGRGRAARGCRWSSCRAPPRTQGRLEGLRAAAAARLAPAGAGRTRGCPRLPVMGEGQAPAIAVAESVLRARGPRRAGPAGAAPGP